jgi:regulator of cell morphogenesis and NO signaling
MISDSLTLAELATTIPSASKVFHRHGLDFCCGGARSLAIACAARGLEPGRIAAEIDSAQNEVAGFARFDLMPLAQLADHIERRYHATLREELPRLIQMAGRVERSHAEKATVPVGLAAHLQEMADALESHMQKEEQILFPMIRSGAGAMVAMPIQVMVHEHDDHAVSLRRLRALAGDFVAPADACPTWRALYLGLDELERELMEHIHLENNVLFPRARRS